MTVLAIDVRHLTKRFGPLVANDDISLQVLAGELHCLLGENGAGKSTLVKIIAGLEVQDRGALAINGLEVAGGRRVEGLEPHVLRRLRHLSAGDAEFAVERVLAAARRAGVRSDDFEARLGEIAAAPLPFPAALDGPTLAPGGVKDDPWTREVIGVLTDGGS